MNAPDPNQRLSRITTLWTLVYQAHGSSEPKKQLAQQQLVERYSGAVHRYLLGALRDSDAADELFQDFCVRLLRGGFRNADSQRGRFRDFLKTAVYHLIVDYQNRRQRQARPLEPEIDFPIAKPDVADLDREFLSSWREELLDRTWLELELLEQRTGQPHHSVLRFRSDHPLLSSDELARSLSERLGKPLSVDAVRQALHRAREKFADRLLDVVAQSVDNPTTERVEQELMEVGLLDYCRSALSRRGK